jgi:hypothetical protein
LAGGINALRDAGARYLFIDTAPSIGGVIPKLFEQADLILIPLNPTPTDLRASVKALPTIKQSGKPFHFLLARVRPNLRTNDAVAMALDAVGLMLPAWLHERVIYAESFAHGKTAFEIEPKGVAAKELAGIWKALKAIIQENDKEKKRERENSSMSKRPSLDLMALTSAQAAPMAEAVQQVADAAAEKPLPKSLTRHAQVKTENLEALAFKVPPLFRKRFKQRAVNADLKLNQLLFEALAAWEEKQGLRK